MKKMIRSAFTAFALLAFSSVAPAAAEEPTLSVSPMNFVKDGYFEVPAPLGEPVELRLEVTTSAEVALRTGVSTAAPMSNGGFGAEAIEVGHPWFSYEQDPFRLTGAQELAYSLTVPEDTAPGEYAAAVIVETEAEQINDTFQHRFQQVVPVNVVVAGEATAIFTAANASHAYGSEGSIISFDLINTGKRHVSPSGTVEVTDSNGQTVSTAPLELGSVYTETTAVASVALAQPLNAGDYEARVKLSDSEEKASAEEVLPFTVHKGEEVPAGSELAEVNQQTNGESPLLWVIAGLLAAVLAGIVALLLRRKKEA